MILLAANVAAAVALLLWSVRLIRTGVERAFLPELKRRLNELSARHLSAASGGLLAAMLMQSSAAVALISAGFAVSGMLALPAALALVLGADLGSALMAQVLFLPVEKLIPFALLAGVVVFLKARARRTKQTGRIMIGFALVLVSLGMLREAVAPIGANEVVQIAARYFETDLISAAVLGALLAWAMHSSLAAVLTFATFALTGLIAAPVAAALVIGANLGGGLIPLMLLWASDRPARIVAMGNLMARGALTVVALALLMLGALDFALAGLGAGQLALLLHIGLNAAVVLVALPFVNRIVALADRILPAEVNSSTPSFSALDGDALDHAPLALACAQRELLRMGETLQAMLVPVMRLMRSWEPEIARVIDLRETAIDRMHFETKIYVSKLRDAGLSSEDEKKTLAIVTIANNLEEAADRISVNLMALAEKMRDSGLSFSEQGLKDLAHFHEQVVTNGQLALSVLTTGDAEAARQLLSEKDRIRIEEQRLQERHLKRLQDGLSSSIETTDIHQEILRLLKQINAAMSYVAAPIAEETGDLLDSRLAPVKRVGGWS